MKRTTILYSRRALLLLLCLSLLLGVCGCTKKAATAAYSVEEGVAFLESKEAEDPAEVDRILQERREAELAAQREQLLEELSSGVRDVWPMFQDYVLLGDSRAVGFWLFDFLDKSRVLADGGDTIRKVADHMDEIVALNPSTIFLCYGLNDVSIGFWNTPESYAEEMMEVVDSLKEKLPNARVVISGILPATDPAFDRSSKWREIPQYSAAVEAAVAERGEPGVLFVNNDSIAAAHMDLWEVDGIHVQRPFYPYWASNLIIAVLEDGQAPAESVSTEG